MPKPIKFCFVYFTYKEDAYLLGQSLRALRMLPRRLANKSNIFVYDDAQNALPYAPNACQYHLSFFNRNGNLNGSECVDGMLFSMLEAAKKTNADVVIKIDSDIIINNMDWVKDFNPLESHIGFQIQNQSHVSGCCYSLPTSALVPMLKSLRNESKSPNIPESILMTSLSEKVGLDKVLHVCDSTNADLWRASSIERKEIETGLTSHGYGLMKNLDVVMCDVIGGNRDKKLNFRLMKEYLDKKSNPL